MSYIEDKNIDVAGICETWLTESHNATTAIIKSYGFSLYHNHRGTQKGGGTAIIFKPIFRLSEISLPCFKSFEVTAALLMNASAKLMLLIVYRTGPLSTVFNQELDQLLSDCSRRCDSIFLAGDLNIHFSSSTWLSKHTLDILSSYNLVKLVNEATHSCGGSLDQIFCTSSTHSISNPTVKVDSYSGLGSDHYPVTCNLNFLPEKKYFKTIIYQDFKNIDNGSFTNDLNDIIDGIDRKDSFSTQIHELTIAVNCLLEEHAPHVTKDVAIVDTAPWFDSEYRDLRKKRRRAEKKKKKSPYHLALYSQLCLEADQLRIAKKKNYFKKVVDNSHGNPKTLYKMVNNVMDRKQTNSLPETDDLEELALTFNNFFTEKIVKIRENMSSVTCHNVSEDKDHSTTLLCEFEPATVDEISDIIKETGVKCSPADLLPQHLYEENISNLTPLLTELVNLSLSTGSMDGVKLADVVPLIKGDNLDSNVLKNYRPVSNLTFLGKLIERVVLKRLNDHLTANNLNSHNQYAYKTHHSTETLIIKIVNDVLIAMDEKEATVIMLLDLSAAFDTVDHDLLLNILKKEIGLRGKVLDWFSSFLKGRSQRIRLGKTTSDCITIKFGVPQGSVLGPVLFNLYLRSIYRVVQSCGFKIFGYADDHQVLKSFRPESQLRVLTHELTRCFSQIKSWMNHFFLQLNDSKTQIIVCGSSKILQQIQIQGIHLTMGTTVRFVDCVKNLGIQMDNLLSFEEQVIHLKKKCYSTLRNICKIRYLLTNSQLKTIVNSLVVSCLDYCNGIYFGIADRLLSQIQLIQNAAAKVVTRKYKYDHVGEDLRDLHWLPVKKRVVFKVALLAYKSVNGLAPEYLKNMFQYSHHGHTLKLIVPQFMSSLSRRSFSYTGPKIFNNLPTSVTSSDTVDIFKRNLKTYLFQITDYDLEKLIS